MTSIRERRSGFAGNPDHASRGLVVFMRHGATTWLKSHKSRLDVVETVKPPRQ